jgi:thiamine biosynthesis lipoprotein
VAIEKPAASEILPPGSPGAALKPARPPAEPPPAPEILAVVPLRDDSLSVSAVWGKHFVIDGEVFGHVLDPRTGWPARDAVLGAVRLPSAAVSDALSTAVLLGGAGVLGQMESAVPGLAWFRVCKEGAGFRSEARGFELEK